MVGIGADSSRLAYQFEKLVSDIFQAEGFVAKQISVPHAGAVHRPDLTLESKSGRTAVVEVKFFRSRSLSPSVILEVVLRIEFLRRETKSDRSVLVTSARVPQLLQRSLQTDNPRLVIYDYDSLRAIASNHPPLAKQLENLFRETMIAVDPQVVPEEGKTYSTETLNDTPRGPSLSSSVNFEAPIGASLCAEIREVKSGRQHARKFEQKIESALRYIFDTDLTAWSPQPVTDTGMSRFDLIARVSSDHEVWKMLKERFQSQYIIFECKNYVDKIRQGEIYSTEKYLYLKALRGVAFIISRNGAHKNALAAARGALREHGKLIVNLSIDDVCKLLALRDGAQDHNGFLFDQIDEMLMKLER